MTVDIEEVIEEATVAKCEAVCCGSDRRTPEEREAQKERRRVGYENAKRNLESAEYSAQLGDVDRAKAYVEIANAWDGTRY